MNEETGDWISFDSCSQNSFMKQSEKNMKIYEKCVSDFGMKVDYYQRKPVINDNLIMIAL